MDYRKLPTQPQNDHTRFLKTHLVWISLAASIPLAGMATAFAVAPGASASQVVIQETTQALALPEIKLANTTDTARYWRAESVRRGDTIPRVLNRLGITDKEALRFIHTSDLSRDLLKLQTGATLHVETDDAGELFSLRFLKDDENGETVIVSIRKQNDSWIASADAIEARILQTPASFQITRSLSHAAARAGLPSDIRAQLSEIFADNPEIQTLKRGDHVELVYESLYSDGDLIGYGRILAAEIRTANSTIRAFYHEKENEENGGYYNADGRPLKEGFSLDPIQGARITSGFGIRRHPILGQLRMHQGIDYAASTGTVIHAPADGVVSKVTTENGYGKVVELRHNNKYTTLYAHMSRFADKLKEGKAVKAGDVIGYVGSTGRSTGSHLHFETRIDGKAVDPAISTLKSPALAGSDMKAFHRNSLALSTQLDILARTPVNIAQTE